MTVLTSPGVNIMADETPLPPLFGGHRVEAEGRLHWGSSVCTPLPFSWDLRDDV